MKAVISVIIFGIATYLPFHFIQRLTGGGFGVLSFVPRFALSFLAAAFLLALGYHVFDISNIYTFPSPINSLFAPEGYFFWWFIAPILGLLFLVHYLPRPLRGHSFGGGLMTLAICRCRDFSAPAHS